MKSYPPIQESIKKKQRDGSHHSKNWLQIRPGQLQATGGSHNSLRAHLRAAVCIIHISKIGGGMSELIRLFTNSKLH